MTAEDEIRGQIRARITAILNCPEAKGATNLAEHLAYNTDISVEDAIGNLRAFQGDLANIRKGPPQSYEERKRAAGALGLAPIETPAEVSQQIWDKAVANSHRHHGIEDPEIGASGRELVQ